jgi:hypothetical protein
MSPTEAEKLAQHLALLRKSAKDITLHSERYNTLKVINKKMLNCKKQCCGSGSESIYVFGPPGLDPDPLIRVMDPNPDPSIIMQK